MADTAWHTCTFCLMGGSMMERLDKKGRPFYRCVACGTTCFIHHARALLGLRLMGAFLARINPEVLAHAVLAGDAARVTEHVTGAMNQFMTATPAQQQQEVRHEQPASGGR